ncbi:hypothetical protein SAY86_010804 [Trapa natans]|uniref:AB hydrolase-1 domain-containing protein n=1 Tax=Trapa natans TaxID=22666 RepID=A0AAN7LIZ2_TRANT|nr:hypothetical protein SAY86_010804 [Trapa natans]
MKMLVHAPPFVIKPLLSILPSVAACRPYSPARVNPAQSVGSFWSRPVALRRAASMADSFSTACDSSQEHTAGTWYSVPELRLRDHRFTIPLDYSLAASPKITVFAREVVSGNMLLSLAKKSNNCHTCYIYKVDLALSAHGQLSLADGYAESRGTGLSTPLTVSSMSQFKSAKDLADYLGHFRADNIVNDAEFVRVHLVPDAEPWTVLGQSYGGFCVVTYLSFAPHGLKQALLTGGIPPIGNGCSANDVYRACCEQIVLQNEKFYKRYPQDIEVVHEVVKYLAGSEGGGVPLPSGGFLTPRGLQTLGLSGLGSSTGFERLHYMFERVWDPQLVPGAAKQISHYFLRSFESWSSFDTNPLYALLHEAIYNQGAASCWSAERVMAENESKFNALNAAKENRPVLFTGEMIFPWMFDEIYALRPFKEAANILAEKKDWPPLYDVKSLNNNKVPVAAAVYYEDMYVNFKLAMETASHITGIRLWISNEYMHSGLRDNGTRVLNQLLGMLNGKKPLF